MKLRSIGRWTVKTLRVAALTGAVVLGATAALAQSNQLPGAGRGAAPKKVYTKNSTFNLPIEMEERTRAALKEVRLYVKSGTNDWVQQEVVGPQTPHFTYRVPQDGEYWFALVTIDKTGRATPADVSQEPPALRVVVDTRPPVLETTVSAELGEVLLHVNLVDANADPQSVRAVVFADGVERPLIAAPGHPGAFRLSATDMNLPVRVAGRDMSGNATTRDLSGRDLMPGGATLVRSEPPLPAATPAVLPPSVNTAPLASAPPAIILPAAPSAPMAHVPPPPPVMTSTPPTTAAPTPTPAATLPPAPAPIATLPPAAPAPITAVPTPAPVAAVPTPVPAPQVNTAVVNNAVYRPNFDANSDKPAGRKILNTTRAQIEYRIDTVGPSGVGKVDVYVTPDRGQNWAKLIEDTDRNSPADIVLPGEGIFGLRLAITNGNGFGGRVPKAGDTPQSFIEVDTTPPSLQMQPHEIVASAGAIDIRWTAADTNLGNEPVSIHFRTRPESGWLPVATRIKNDGLCRWVLPRDIGAQVYLKIEVADMAGNLTKVESPGPILLDQTELEATLVDVVGMNARQAPAVPNTLPPLPPR